VEPIATIATTKLHPGEQDKPEEGDSLYHSHLCKRHLATPRYTSSLIVVSRRTSSQQRTSSSWPCQQRHAHKPMPLDGSTKEAISTSINNAECRMKSIPSKTRYCVMFLLSNFVILLVQPYLWKSYILYESRHRSVIITLNRKLYRIPEEVPPSVISLISVKKCRKVISQITKFFFFIIPSHSERKITTTYRASTVDLSTQHKQVDKVMQEYSLILSSPTGVPLHFQVKHLIDLNLGSLLPNGPFYQCSLLENEEIKRKIQELLHKRNIHPSSSPCGSPIMLVQKKYGTW
jgi:hypothetical protein